MDRANWAPLPPWTVLQPRNREIARNASEIRRGEGCFHFWEGEMKPVIQEDLDEYRHDIKVRIDSFHDRFLHR